MDQDRQPPSPQSEEQFMADAREMVLLKEQKTRLAKRETALKNTILKYLESYGQDSGIAGQHRRIEFPTPIRNIVAFVRQVRSSVGVDETVAEAIARDKGIYDELFRPVMTLDEEAVMVAVERGLLDEDDIARIFPRSTSVAFVMEKDK